LQVRAKPCDGLSRCVRGITRNDLALGHAAQPGELALGKLPGGRRSPLAQRRKVAFAMQIRPHLTIADGSKRRKIGMQVASLLEFLNFFDQTRPKHRIEALGKSFM
jgi:hypothetical protein